MGNQLLPCILCISIALQLASTVYALVLIKTSGFFKPWLLIASAIALMSVRRIVSLIQMLKSGVFPPEALEPELIALIITVLMLSGLLLFGPAFEIIKRQREQEVQEKNYLLRESHHRIKNDLQILKSLINLQINSSLSGDSAKLLREIDLRISSFLLLHEYMYRDGVSGISFRDYIRRLADSIHAAFDDGRVALSLNISDTGVERKNLLHCGIILNEALTNAYKYAFGQTESPRIIVSDRVENGRHYLTITDNGCGFETPGASSESSYGLSLIQGIAGSEGWDFRIDGSDGTTVEVSFPAVVDV